MLHCPKQGPRNRNRNRNRNPRPIFRVFLVPTPFWACSSSPFNCNLRAGSIQVRSSIPIRYEIPNYFVAWSLIYIPFPLSSRVLPILSNPIVLSLRKQRDLEHHTVTLCTCLCAFFTKQSANQHSFCTFPPLLPQLVPSSPPLLNRTTPLITRVTTPSGRGCHPCFIINHSRESV